MERAKQEPDGEKALQMLEEAKRKLEEIKRKYPKTRAARGK